jgi:type III restriction enzyme
VYDSDNLSQVRQFALSDGAEIMVMTIDSFNKGSNVIRQSTDRLQGETPIHLVQAARPILILDEPQNMESELRIQALSALDPLFALRYSATHHNPYNLVHRLTPFEAYRQGLVKRIEVAGVEKEDDVNRVFLRLDGFSQAKKVMKAKIAVHKLMKGGAVKEKVVTVKPSDSLRKKTGRTEYDGYEVDEINRGAGTVRFTNDVEIALGDPVGADKEAIFESQIHHTIGEHFRKQSKLKPHGIKVLSLFFIDRVANYEPDNSVIKRLFKKAFDELKSTKYPEWDEFEAGEVQAAYFAQKRRKTGDVELLDTVSGKTKEDEAAYDLIMKDKERLLSFEEPVAFIFSHSALREGWDNPNVCQICTLRQVGSESERRQQVGRGVRLVVNQDGARVRDEKLNVLTVVANESYERYVAALQEEVVKEFGMDGAGPKPTNARKRATASLRKEYVLRPEFNELWEKIKYKTQYAVKIDTEALLKDVIAELDKAEIRPPRVTIKKAQVQVGEADEFTPLQMTGGKTVLNLAGRYPLPNIVEIMTALMENTSPPVRLTRKTLLEVFKRYKFKQSATDNPQEFATVAVRTIKAKVADHLVNGIQYEKINEWYEMTKLEGEIEGWMDYLVDAGSASLYDLIDCDSDIERDFVKALDARKDVKLYFKLPSWFKVETPVGKYNPDWAIVMEECDVHGEPVGEQYIYLVRETKGNNWKTSLRPSELRKIRCGAQHFNGGLKTDYRVVTSAGDLPGGELP